MMQFTKIDKDFMIYKTNNVFLFGASKIGKYCKKILEKKGVYICGFIDNAIEKQGTEICNLPVISFLDFLEIAGRKENVLIQITSRFEREIITQIEENGYDNYISYTEFVVCTRQLSMYMTTYGDQKLKEMIYKSHLQSNLRAPVSDLLKREYFERKWLVGRDTLNIMLSAFTVGNHAILETDDGKSLIALNHSYKWMDEELWSALKEEPIRVIIGVGDPVAQNISLMYQICEYDFWDLDIFYGGGYRRFLMST